jgi:hypothetical protein
LPPHCALAGSTAAAPAAVTGQPNFCWPSWVERAPHLHCIALHGCAKSNIPGPAAACCTTAAACTAPAAGGAVRLGSCAAAAQRQSMTSACSGCEHPGERLQPQGRLSPCSSSRLAPGAAAAAWTDAHRCSAPSSSSSRRELTRRILQLSAIAAQLRCAAARVFRTRFNCCVGGVVALARGRSEAATSFIAHLNEVSRPMFCIAALRGVRCGALRCMRSLQHAASLRGRRELITVLQDSRRRMLPRAELADHAFSPFNPHAALAEARSHCGISLVAVSSCS